MKTQHIINFSTLTFLVGVLFSCSNSAEEVSKFADENILPAQTSYNTEVFYTDSAKIKGKLFAKELEQFLGDTSYTLMPKGLFISFFNNDEELESTLKAEKGALLKNQSVMIAEKNVVVENTKGEKLETNKLVWLRDSARFETKDPVKITQQEAIINGIGLTANENFSKYKIDSITGIVYFSETDSINNGEIP